MREYVVPGFLATAGDNNTGEDQTSVEAYLAEVAQKYGKAAAAHEASEILDGYSPTPPETHTPETDQGDL